MDFTRYPLTARFLSPDSSTRVEKQLEVRVDPLLGNTSRIVEGITLPTAEPGALDPIQKPDPTCPFCPERIHHVTPRLLPSIAPEGRLRLGETTVVPNLVPYGRYSAVAVMSPRHWLSLPQFTPDLLADSLAASIDYIRRVHAHDPDAAFAAYNINYLYPSGGSLPHPHAQIYVDPQPTTMLRLLRTASADYLARNARSFWDDLIEEEEARGERFIGRIDATAWLTPFAPLGFNEVRAVVPGRETILDLSAEDIRSLAAGISRVLGWYESRSLNSFNLVLQSGRLGGDPGFRVNLVMVSRSALNPYYRSDAMYLERLHWEAAVDRTPEDIAASLRTLPLCNESVT